MLRFKCFWRDTKTSCFYHNIYSKGLKILEFIPKDYEPENCYKELSNLPVYPIINSIHRSKFIRYLNIWFARIILSWKLSRKKQIINVHDQGFQWVIIFSKILNPRLIIIWQINDLAPSFKVGINKDKKKNLLDYFGQFSTRLAMKFTDKITVNVSKNKERIKTLCNYDSNLIYCGVEGHDYHIKNGKHKVPDIFSLLTIGVLFKYRNYETIIKAQEYLEEHYETSIKCSAVGETRLSPNYKKKIQSLVSKSNITFELLGSVQAK